MEIYKNWKIEKGDYGYYEATNLKDCDAFMKFSKNKDELKAEIDEEKIYCSACHDSGLVEGEHFDDLQPCRNC